jgi:hypothetical protein
MATLIFDPEAKFEIREAAAYYEQISKCRLIQVILRSGFFGIQASDLFRISPSGLFFVLA